MHNLYELKIIGKDIKRFINYLILHNISLYHINYNKNEITILVDKNNLEKIKKIKTSYEIKIIKYYGLIKYKQIFKQNKVFIITLFFGFMLLFLLNNMVFNIEIVHNDRDLRKLILSEINEKGINKFHFKVSYKTKEKIKKEILTEYKDKIEWLEITNIGTKYIINVEERIINNIQNDNTPRDIIASKDGIISSIDASQGEIVKKINDYVKKGDIIISGNINKNGQIVSKVKALGTVYAETWYQVNVEMPLTYYEIISTGKSKKSLVLKIFNKSYVLNGFKKNKYQKIISINHSFLPISLMFSESKEIKVVDDIYTIDEAINKALMIGHDKIIKQLDKNEKILFQKNLKSTINNNKITVDIFFKIYEDITSYKKIDEVITDE